MNDLAELVQAALTAPLEWARSRTRAGERVVGVVGADIPLELIAAGRSVALQLPVTIEESTVDADRYLESSFMPQTRMIAHQWLKGDFDFIDAVILSRANDSAQRLYYYLCELQRRGITAGPRLLLYDLAKIPRPTSVAHSLTATRRLALDLGIDTAALPAALAARDRRRRLFGALDQRRRSPAPPDGPWVERLVRASDRTDAIRFDAVLEDWLRRPATEFRGPRVLLVGTVPPDERLHAAVEQGGGRIVGESGEHALTRLGAPPADIPDVLQSLALHYQALPYGPRTFEDHAANVAADARSYRADGVILWIIEEDESIVWSVPKITQALQSANLPVLCLTRRRWNGGDGAVAAIRSFVEALQGAP